ncbi:MAG: NADH-quinone oxidoreductase subunit L [Deltaproteobacteria bacterium]|nr:NADH-quinone oxidoreductase subunit L [Deltaproteobacteria bacterium]PIU79801.1 MAG: NADH-quinone oxidoreductase subunit L [Nitrospirae bacterium CG06_land_8_20_14_3_00_70_43]PIW82617.1 MAG: NADH-quinone oxidoreductase subunit L [Nitrospirae bacterium CG_4_8_14_3_um_filter_70_85]
MTTTVWILVLPLLAFLVNGLFSTFYPRPWSHRIATAAVLAALALSLGMVAGLLTHPGSAPFLYGDLYTWIGAGTFAVTVGVQVDPLTAMMLVVVTGISSAVHVYSTGYMANDPGYRRFFTFLSLFTFSMLLLVLANNFLLLYVGWELVGVCSYYLIGFWYEKRSAADAGKKAFVVNRVGDFGFGLGVFLIWVTFGTLDYHQVFARAGEVAGQNIALLGMEVPTLTLICLLLFVGAMGKSAQFPLHVWLPDAMEGPTPVSALIHAATMVTAGVYMVARCAALFDLAPVAADTVAVVGGFTALFAASIGLVQNDIKRVLAYSTVSQLGYMFLAAGLGAYGVAAFHLMTHAFFKGLLFLCSGAVIHSVEHGFHAAGVHADPQDMRNMGGLRTQMPVTYRTFVVGALAIAGIPPLAGFCSKDLILERAFAHGDRLGLVLWGGGALAALMTAFYMFRLIFMTFHGRARYPAEAAPKIHESPVSMTRPLVVLALFSCVAGLVGWPELLGGPSVVHLGGGILPFLSPAFGHGQAGHAHELAAAVAWALMGLSVAVGVVGIAIAFALYVVRPEAAVALGRRFPMVHGVLLNKYFVDELYDLCLVRSIKRLADLLHRGFDVFVIDGIVNGTAILLRDLGALLRPLQTGRVNNYATAMVTGVVVLAVVALATWL